MRKVYPQKSYTDFLMSQIGTLYGRVDRLKLCHLDPAHWEHPLSLMTAVLGHHAENEPYN